MRACLGCPNRSMALFLLSSYFYCFPLNPTELHLSWVLGLLVLSKSLSMLLDLQV